MRQWVLEISGVAGKQYKNLRHIVKTQPDGKSSTPFRGVYLTPKAKAFERAVREAATEAGVEVCEYAEIQVFVYWPDKDTSTKTITRSGVVKKGRPDLSNVQKSAEDALQRLRTPSKLLRERRILESQQVEQLHLKDIDGAGRTHEKIKLVGEKIANCVAKSLIGACIVNDRDILAISSTIKFIAPGLTPRVFVRIKERTRESHYHTSLHEWLKGDER